MSWSQTPRRSTRAAPEPVDDDWHATPRSPVRRRGAGPSVGGVRVTASRVTLLAAIVGSIIFLVYTITIRDASPPLLSSGAGVLGIVFAALAVTGGYHTWQAASDGRMGRALVLAIGGGIAGMISALCFALALVLAMVWRSTGPVS